MDCLAIGGKLCIRSIWD